MKPIIQNKQDAVSEISTVLKGAKSFLFFEYKGITGKQATKIRNLLHTANAKMYVKKNNIFNRALKEAGHNDFSEIVNQSALIVGNGDEIAPFKILNDTIKVAPFLKFTVGLLESQIVDANKFKSIASLPSREALYSMLLSCLTCTIADFARAVNAVGEKK
jgi:large subunit ribosomal protein L10